MLLKFLAAILNVLYSYDNHPPKLPNKNVCPRYFTRDNIDYEENVCAITQNPFHEDGSNVTVYINPEKPNSSMSISAEVSGLTDLKLKGIDQSARNLHGELNLKEFTGGISIGKKGQMAGISLNDAALNSYLIQNNLYMDIDNKAFQKSFNEFAGKVDQIAESTGDVAQTFFNDKAKYAISCYAGGEFSKFYLGNFFGSKSAEEPIFGRDLYTLSFSNFRETNVRKFFDETNFYDLVSYRKFRHGDFSISGKFTGETLSHFLLIL